MWSFTEDKKFSQLLIMKIYAHSILQNKNLVKKIFGPKMSMTIRYFKWTQKI